MTVLLSGALLSACGGAEGSGAGADSGDASGSRARYVPVDDFPQILDDGRRRTRYAVRSLDPDDVWQYRCFQPNRFTDLSDPRAPVYDDADWDHIEFDVVEPAGGGKAGTPWLVLLSSGGMSIAEDAAWTTPLDASDPAAQDEVIMPWPGTELAEDCGGEPARCALRRSARVGDEPPSTNKANEGGLWRAAADRQWTGAPPDYQGFERAPFNGLVDHLRRVEPGWGFVEISGCARDNFGGEVEGRPHRDRVPWGYQALLAALELVRERYEPAGFFFTGASSGGVATMMVAERLRGEGFDDELLGFIPDAGGADYDAFRRHKDEASANGGWHWLANEGVYSVCQSTSWTMGEVFDGVVHSAVGFRAQERLMRADGGCDASPSGDGCLAGPILLGTTTRDFTLLCGATDVFRDVYEPTIEAMTALRTSGKGIGHGVFVDGDATAPIGLCETVDRPVPDCDRPVGSEIAGTGHTVNGSAHFQQVATRWMQCLADARGDRAAMNECAFDCRVQAGDVTCR